MGKSRYERTGIGLISWALLVVLMYVFVSLAIGYTTNDKMCGIGQHRDWRFVPPGWVCD
jgi:hypothetical protein